MVEVPWLLDTDGSEDSNALNHFLQRNWGMPWLDYLIDNNQGIECERVYKPDIDMYEVIFKFKIEPKKETYYRLKYG